MRDISKLRKNDEKLSNIVSNFLDKFFYSNNTTNFNRIFNKDEQVKGIDVKFNLNNFNYLCDEKAAIRYVNKGLKTFSMELSFIDRKGNIHDGWLLDKEKINNSFMFIWIDSAKNDFLQAESDINELEIAIVKKDNIINYLESIGWNYSNLIEKSIRIRNNENEDKGNIYINGCKFVISNFLVEKPVNILIERKILRNISDYNQIIKNK